MASLSQPAQAIEPPPQPTAPAPIDYPSSDGQPVAETYLHLNAIIAILKALELHLKGQQATVLANQFLYFSEGFPRLRVAPDTMVILNVVPGGRDNYKAWEEGQAPSVVFEVTSKGTQSEDQTYKYTLYEQMGVQEYWLFDPKHEWIEGQLQGYRLMGDRYIAITDQRSKVLELRLQIEGPLLRFVEETTGALLPIPDEMDGLVAELRSTQQRADRLAALLREQGIDPDAIASGNCPVTYCESVYSHKREEMAQNSVMALDDES
jgi:Uma2 family endonuclease